MNAATSAEQTGSFPVRRGIDEDIRQDVMTAAWMMAAVTLPGLGVLALVL